MPPPNMKHSVWVLSRPSRTCTALGRQPLSVMVSRETAPPDAQHCVMHSLQTPAPADQARPLDSKVIALLNESPVPQQLSPTFHVKRPHGSNARACALGSLANVATRQDGPAAGGGTGFPLNPSARYSAVATAVSREEMEPGLFLSSLQGSDRESAPAGDAPRRHTVPSGPLVSRSRDTSAPPFHVKQTGADRGAVQAAHAPIASASDWLSPANRPHAVECPPSGPARALPPDLASGRCPPMAGATPMEPDVRGERFRLVSAADTVWGARALLA